MWLLIAMLFCYFCIQGDKGEEGMKGDQGLRGRLGHPGVKV